VYALDTSNALSNVNIENELDVRRFLYKLKREKIVSNLIRIRDLKRLMAPDFTSADIQLVDAHFIRTAADLDERDRNNAMNLALNAKRTNILNQAVSEGLLDEHRDHELFRSIIRSHAKSLTSSTPV
jgi:hypothetical protein